MEIPPSIMQEDEMKSIWKETTNYFDVSHLTLHLVFAIASILNLTVLAL